MAKHEIVVNRLTSNDLNDITLGVKQAYEEELHYADFSDDELINKRALDEVVPAEYDPPAPYIDFVNPGDNMPKSFSLPARFNNKFGIKFEILLPVSGGAYFSDTNGATMTYQTLWLDNTYQLVNRVDIYGAPDDAGKFADKFMFTVYAL